MSGLNQAVAVAAMCLQEEAMVRPFIGDAVVALSFLTTAPVKPETPSQSMPPPEETTPIDTDENQDEESDEEQYVESAEDERQRAVAEAIEWCSNSKGTSRRSNSGGSSRGSNSGSSKYQSEAEDSS